MKTKPQKFGPLLQSLRGDPRDGGVSRAVLAKAAQMHEKGIVKLEAGRASPRLSTMRALASGLAITRGKMSANEYFSLLLDSELALLGE